MSLKELEAYLEETAEALGHSPYGALVTRHGEPLWEHYSAGKDGAPLGPVTEASLWPLYSCTKSYIATLILSLADDGILTLDDPISTYLPEFGTPGTGPFSRQSVTLRHLATHTSGAALPEGDDPDFSNPINCEQVAVETDPGEVFNYTGLGMHLLERVLEAATGQDLEAALRARLFEPLGLPETRYFDAVNPNVPMMPVKVDGDLSERYRIVPARLRCHYGLYTTVREANRFGQLWLGDGTFEEHRYFSPELKAEAWTYHITRPIDGGRYGLLWWLHEDHGSYIISGAGAKETVVCPDTGIVITVLRIPLQPESSGYHFYTDKVNLSRFAAKLG